LTGAPTAPSATWARRASSPCAWSPAGTSGRARVCTRPPPFRPGRVTARCRSVPRLQSLPGLRRRPAAARPARAEPDAERRRLQASRRPGRRCPARAPQARLQGAALLQELRRQLCFAALYLLTCRDAVADDFRRRVFPKEYLFDEVDLYSVAVGVGKESGGKAGLRLLAAAGPEERAERGAAAAAAPAARVHDAARAARQLRPVHQPRLRVRAVRRPAPRLPLPVRRDLPGARVHTTPACVPLSRCVSVRQVLLGLPQKVRRRQAVCQVRAPPRRRRRPHGRQRPRPERLHARPLAPPSPPLHLSWFSVITRFFYT